MSLHAPTLARLTDTVWQSDPVQAAIEAGDPVEADDLVAAAVRATLQFVTSDPSWLRALGNGNWPDVTGAGH
jgi:hypothetical protein